MHALQARELKHGFAIRPCQEGAYAARTAAVRHTRRERRVLVDAQAAFVADPTIVAGVLVEGVTVASSRRKTGDVCGAFPLSIADKSQMI